MSEPLAPTIDLITAEPDGSVLFVLVDRQDWADLQSCEAALADRIEAALAYALDGAFAAAHPSLADRN